MIQNRINNFLSKTQFAEEFSHTILHKIDILSKNNTSKNNPNIPIPTSHPAVQGVPLIQNEIESTNKNWKKNLINQNGFEQIPIPNNKQKINYHNLNLNLNQNQNPENKNQVEEKKLIEYYEKMNTNKQNEENIKSKPNKNIEDVKVINVENIDEHHEIVKNEKQVAPSLYIQKDRKKEEEPLLPSFRPQEIKKKRPISPKNKKQNPGNEIKNNVEKGNDPSKEEKKEKAEKKKKGREEDRQKMLEDIKKKAVQQKNINPTSKEGVQWFGQDKLLETFGAKKDKNLNTVINEIALEQSKIVENIIRSNSEPLPSNEITDTPKFLKKEDIIQLKNEEKEKEIEKIEKIEKIEEIEEKKKENHYANNENLIIVEEDKNNSNMIE